MTAAELDAIILSFEQSWQRRESWLPQQFVERCGALSTQERRELLLELVAIDMEYRWRQQAAGESQLEPLTLDDYVRQIPELRDPPMETISEEYRCRARSGDARGAGESLLRRYPLREMEIRNIIASVDEELRVEQESTVDWREEPKTDRTVIDELCESPAEQELLDWSDYVLQKRIGAGRTGHIYRALQRSTGQTVAIKFLRKSFWSDQRITSRFLDEAGISREPAHPGLLPLHGFGHTPRGSYFIAMDLATGGSLEETIRSRTVTIEESIRWTVEACAVMQHMHERGIIHCDLKPANLLLGDRSQILVADFGLACSVVEQRTADSQIAGTAPFMAPEQVSSHWGPLSARTDVYGLGAVLYTLLTGVPPHDGRSSADVLARVASGVAIIPPRMRCPELSIELNDACMRSLAKPPEDRFASARAFAEALRQIP